MQVRVIRSISCQRGKASLDDCERLIKTVIGSGWSEENKEDKGVKIELKRGRGISTQEGFIFFFNVKKGFLEFHRDMRGSM